MSALAPLQGTVISTFGTGGIVPPGVPGLNPRLMALNPSGVAIRPTHDFLPGTRGVVW